MEGLAFDFLPRAVYERSRPSYGIASSAGRDNVNAVVSLILHIQKTGKCHCQPWPVRNCALEKADSTSVILTTVDLSKSTSANRVGCRNPSENGSAGGYRQMLLARTRVAHLGRTPPCPNMPVR